MAGGPRSGVTEDLAHREGSGPLPARLPSRTDQLRATKDKGDYRLRETGRNTENAGYLNEEVANAPETICDTGLLLPQPVIVRNADVVHIFKECVFTGKNQFVQAFGA